MPLAAHTLGRKFWAFDKDSEAIKEAQLRMARLQASQTEETEEGE